MTIQRCRWCSTDPIYMAYHDDEWGKPLYHAHALFSMLCLEGQQAGLAWITVLKKREHYQRHFFQYSIEQIAAFSDQDLAEKQHDPGLIRHWGKLSAIRDNAIAWLSLKHEGIDPVTWLWHFVQHEPIQHDVVDYRTAPTQTVQSLHMSQELKKKGFKFVGPITCYAFMQAVGMVNDHENDCHVKLKSRQLKKG